MAEILVGGVELKRIAQLLEKVLSESDLSDYKVAIDKDGELDTKQVSLDQLLAFASVVAGAEFLDNVFKIKNSSDTSKVIDFLLSGITTATTRTLTVPDISGLLAVAGMVNAFSFGGQAHSGNNVKTFSASATFNANDGNNQEMLVTASTTIAVSNELPGTYIITLEIDTVTPPTITIGASLGTPVDNILTLINADNDINIITLVVRPDTTKYYTINTITA